MNWLAPLKTTGQLALTTLRFLARILYILSTPLRWALYRVYASVVFLLSPLWIMIRLLLGAVAFVVNIVARFKYLYIYLACAAIIGICAGLVLFGTSRFVFVLMGVDTASEQQKLKSRRRRRYLGQSQSSRLSFDVDEDAESKDYGEELESMSPSEESSNKWGQASTSSGSSWRQFGKSRDKSNVDPNDLFEKRWKSLQTPEQPKRRRKGGLLAQTIHEESSESDF